MNINNLKERKAIYLLCLVKDTCRLNRLKQLLTTNNEIKWMDYNMLKKSQRLFNLMGFEPLTMYKQIKESK